jgi:2-keto-4-pentenoate hydratase/2-oxohepta-3-ene-1,7-dioic acid hydratase in catechol pathway
MKLVRYGRPGREKPGILDAEGRVRDLSRVIKDITPAAFAPAVWTKLKKLNVAKLPRVAGKPRLGPPIAGVGHVIGVGLNYADHAKENNLPLPTEPLLFSKAVTSISGPNDPVKLPKGSQKSDWEVELAIVMGRVTRYVSEAQALNYVAGYCICNDVSEREWQCERAGQFVKGKSADTFAPLGPWLVSRDEIRDPQNLKLWLELNGERTQNGTTANMVAGCARLVSYISQFMTLAPGDVITTGTPAGVGHAKKPPRYLRPGDVMRLGVEGLGEQRQKVVAFKG